MKLGFTGTRHGMTPKQKEVVEAWMVRFDPEEFYHGNCAGADVEAAAFACRIGVIQRPVKVIAHPCTIKTVTDDTKLYDEILPEETPFKRNRTIVDKCNAMLAAPPTMEPQERGGTWYTINYAKKKRKPLVIVFPDGSIEITNRNE